VKSVIQTHHKYFYTVHRQTDTYTHTHTHTHTSASTKGTDIQNVEDIPDKFNALESVFKKLVLPKNEIK